jgi:hypothetical protein
LLENYKDVFAASKEEFVKPETAKFFEDNGLFDIVKHKWIEKGIEQSAKKMLLNGIDIDLISKISDLSPEKIKSL